MTTSPSKWYGIYNVDTEEFYPLYGTSPTQISDIAQGMNKKSPNGPAYIHKEVDIDKVFRVD